MSEAKLTPWFPGSVKPVRPGVYNVSCLCEQQTGLWFGYWNGRHWHLSWSNDPGADWLPRPPVTGGTPVTWRGLAEPPK